MNFFTRLDEKYKLLGNFEKILKFFDKNSLEKVNLYLFLEKLLLKIKPSEITSFFYNISFNFGGGGTFPVFPPAGATAEMAIKSGDTTPFTLFYLIIGVHCLRYA